MVDYIQYIIIKKEKKIVIQIIKILKRISSLIKKKKTKTNYKNPTNA